MHSNWGRALSSTWLAQLLMPIQLNGYLYLISPAQGQALYYASLVLVCSAFTAYIKAALGSPERLHVPAVHALCFPSSSADSSQCGNLTVALQYSVSRHFLKGSYPLCPPTLPGPYFSHGEFVQCFFLVPMER